jgi:hypothetical protein
MNLDHLLNSLEKAASEKQATGAKDKENPLVSKEIDTLLNKEAAETSLTRAYEEGEKLAKEVLEKLANDAISQAPAEKQEENQDNKTDKDEADGTEKTASTEDQEAKTEEDSMNKEANENNKSLATQILEKLAQDVTADNNAGGPNKLQKDQSVLVAQHDARIGAMPGRNGTINQLFEAIVAKAKSLGYVDYNIVQGGTSLSAAEGKDPGSAKSIPPSPDVQEKQAAVQALIEAGMEWDNAVELVKAAAEEIEAEEIEQVKVAAVNELVSEGFDFEQACELVKAAAEEELYEFVEDPEGEYVLDASSAEGDDEAEGETEAEEFTDVEKTAAVNELLGEGYAFDEAIEIVKQASIASKAKSVMKAGKGFVAKMKAKGAGAAHSAKLAKGRLVRKAGKHMESAKAEAGKRYSKVKKHVGKHKAAYAGGAGAAAGAAAGAGAMAARKKD